MRRMQRVLFYFWVIVLLCIKHLMARKTFIVSFQASTRGGSLKPSIDEWIEYRNTIPKIKEFTACKWIKINYFARDIAAVLWSYCSKGKNDPSKKIRCLEIFLKNKWENANRHLEVNAFFPWSRETNTMVTAEIKPYLHRHWIHICWSFSTLTGISQIFYNGNLMNTQHVENNKGNNLFNNEDGKYGLQKAFIFGQEPDEIIGDFDHLESFLGELGELSIWGHIVSDLNISRMANCKDDGYEKKGDIIAWEVNNFIVKRARIHEGIDTKMFCNPVQKYVVFPQKRLFKDAKKVCEIHGGRLAAPTSDEEHEMMMSILEQNKLRCQERTESRDEILSWLGAKMENKKWYQIEADGQSGQELRYTRALSFSFDDSYECSYIQSDGSWLGGKYSSCIRDMQEKFCAICKVPNTPVFTIKGICDQTKIDWNYYMKLDTKSNTITHYEGYKVTNLVFDQNRWKIIVKEGVADFKAKMVETNTHPFGRHTWHMTDPNCGIFNEIRNITISACEFGADFTCHSGQCIEMKNRCDEKNDCSDGSDEVGCESVIIPHQYIKSRPPPADGAKKQNDIKIDTNIIILSIDEICTVKMLMSLTLMIRMKWYDSRLAFTNPLMLNKTNSIPDDLARQIWIPLEDVIFDNAIIGEINKDQRRETLFQSNRRQKMDAGRTEENVIFRGEDNQLQLMQRLSIKYNCIFDVKSFPFDKESCNFTMRIKGRKHVSITFVEDGVVSYPGPIHVDQFEIENIESLVEMDNSTGSNYIITISLSRDFTHQLVTCFVPTFIVWLLTYLTLFMDIEYLSDRIMVAVTALLVLASVLDSINEDLPKTSYIKGVDFWFLWHFGSMMQIILFHIFLQSQKISLETKRDYSSRQRREHENNQRRLFDVLFDNKDEHAGHKMVAATVTPVFNTTSDPILKPPMGLDLSNSFFRPPSYKPRQKEKSKLSLKDLNIRGCILITIVNCLFYTLYFCYMI